MYIRLCVFIEEEQIVYKGIVSVLLLLTPVYVHGVTVCFLVLSFVLCTHVAAQLLCAFSLADSNICKLCNSVNCTTFCTSS
jgi:hypothetical protein